MIAKQKMIQRQLSFLNCVILLLFTISPFCDVAGEESVSFKEFFLVSNCGCNKVVSFTLMTSFYTLTRIVYSSHDHLFNKFRHLFVYDCLNDKTQIVIFNVIFGICSKCLICYRLHRISFIFFQKIEVTGADCKLTEPVYNSVFNLNSLHTDLGHKVDGEGKDFIEFNLCGNLTKACGGSDSATACFHRDGAEYALGD